MAPAVVRSSVSKSTVLHQQWRCTSPGASQVPVTRISPEPVNGHAKSTCRIAKRIPLAGKIILNNPYRDAVQPQCDTNPTPVSSRIEGSEEHDGAPFKKRRLVFVPVSSDVTDAELEWHAKNLEKLLQIDSSDNATVNKMAPRVHVIRSRLESVKALQTCHTKHTAPLGPVELDPAASSAEAIEVAKCVPDLLDLHCSRAVDQLPQEFNVPSLSPFKAVPSVSKSQQGEIQSSNNKHPCKTKNFDFKAIAGNLDADGCISHSDVRSRSPTKTGLQDERIESQVLAEVPVKSAAGSPRKSNPGAFVESGMPSKANLELCTGSKTFGPTAVSENSNIASTHSLSDRYARNDEVLEKGVLQNEHTAPVNSDPKTVDCGNTAGHLSSREGMGFSVPGDPKLGSHAGSRWHPNGEQNSGFSVAPAAASDGDYIPTVVEEYSAKSPLKSNRKSSKRQNKKLKPNPPRKRARSEFLEPSPGVTEYTSFIGWAGGKMIASRPKPQRGTRNYASAAKNPDPSDATVQKPASGISASFEDRDKASLSLLEGVASRAVGKVSSDSVGCASTMQSPDPASHGKEVNLTVLNENDAAEALLCLTNSFYEKAATANAKMDEEFRERAGKVIEHCGSLDEGGKDSESNNTSGDEVSLHLKNDQNKIAAELDADRLEGKADKVVESDGSQKSDASMENLLYTDDEDMNDFAASFCSYLRSLVRPEGFPDNPEMKFKCFICGELFPCYIDLERHSVKNHFAAWENVKNSYLRVLVPYFPGGFLEGQPHLTYKCVFCSRLFSHRWDLEVHLAEKHYGDQPYECPFCSERFKNEFSYSGHLNEHIHLNDYPTYPCNDCSASFSSEWQLDLHSSIHERRSSPKIY